MIWGPTFCPLVWIWEQPDKRKLPIDPGCIRNESKPWIFMTFLGGSKIEKIMKMQSEFGQIWVSGALDPRKMISNKIPKKSGFFQPKKPIFYRNYQKNKSGSRESKIPGPLRKFDEFQYKWPSPRSVRSSLRTNRMYQTGVSK